MPRIAANLEKAYAEATLPPLSEPERFAERLAKWDDFRACTVRTFVARKRDADRAAREGRKRPSRHAGIGEEAVEECAVQAAVADKDPSVCERLALDFPGPGGEMPLSAVRCWDTRARVLGLPDECPVVWLSDDQPGRNPECVALARRDGSLCPFADSPGRCRALLLGESASCANAAPDCPLALTYWSGLIPAAIGPPLVDLTPPKGEAKALFARFDLSWRERTHPSLRIDATEPTCGVSWPARHARVGFTQDMTKFWGGNLSPDAVAVSWRDGRPGFKLAFIPAGMSKGSRPMQAPGVAAPATLVFVWPDPTKFLRCLPDSETKGQIDFDAGTAQPGAFVTGRAEAKNMACSDGTRLDATVTFRLAILDVR